MLVAREQLRRTRVHHQLQTDDAAPARQFAVGTRTPAVADDGPDVAAALRTIEVEGAGAGDTFTDVVVRAIDGARVAIGEDGTGSLLPTTARLRTQPLA